MAINPDIRDQAYQFFIEEAPELLQVIEAGLLTLNQEHSTGKVHSLMRAAHSLKGGASSVGLDGIATLAHRLENIFKALYNDVLATDPDLENWLLQAYDCLRLPLIEQITTGAFDQAQALTAAEPIFNRIEEYCGDALIQADSYIPSSTEMGIDLVQSIFEVDVAEGLQQLAALADENCDASQLQPQIEIFLEFAELFNLPNFKATVQAVQQALMLHPNRATEIAQLALTEIESSRQAVLAGNSVGGAGPSATLMRLATAGAHADLDQISLVEIDNAGYISSVNDTGDITGTGYVTNAGYVTNTDDVADIDEVSDVAGIDVAETDIDQFSIPSTEEIEPLTVEVAAVPETPTELDLSLLESVFGNGLFTPLELKPDAEELATDDSLLLDGELEDAYPIDVLFTEAEPGIVEPVAEHQVTPVSTEPENTATAEPEAEPEKPSVSPAAYSPEYRAGSNSNWQSATPAPHVAPMTVRVDSDRLERMNNLVGELGINRSSLSLQNDQLQRVLRELRSRFSRFRTAVNRLQTLSDQMVIAPERTDLRAGSEPTAETRVTGKLPFSTYAVSSTVSSESSLVEFDTLEMDRYGADYSQLQAILEDLVQLEESVDDIALFARQANQTLDQQQTQLTQLRDELVWARMLPLSEILHRFPRVLRDLSVTYQKPVNLNLVGAEVLIDRAILEKLYDPLLHLLRNAFDHGIEPAYLRRQQGKLEQGQIEIRAFHQGNQTVIEVQDDGQGLNLERIRQRVIELRWLSAEQVAVMSPRELLELIFEPGFSTATQVSELSGRGFGLDVVRSQLQALRGTVTATSSPGQGTTFTLSLPLTLAITQVIICLAGNLPLALPADGIIDILTPESNQIRQSDNQHYLFWREQTIPMYSLTQLLYYGCPVPMGSASRVLAAFPAPKDWAAPAVILRTGQQIFAVTVDRILTEQELLIKPFGSAIAPPSYMYGCTILGDGSPIPVIDAAALVSLWLQPSDPNQTAGAAQGTVLSHRSALVTHSFSPHLNGSNGRSIQLPTVLVVDDAVTLRRTLALFLEREGFRVLQAQDGQEAIEQLQQDPTVKLIVCDIEMPNMNGFEFLSYRRKNPQLANLPIVILTSRSNEKHRRLAMQLGATAYFTKPYLEQELLTVLRTML